jgi:hypothetical protein
MLGHHHLELLGQQLEHRQPHRQAVGAVQEQQRRPGTAAAHPDRDIPHRVGGKACGHVYSGHVSSNSSNAATHPFLSDRQR